MKKQKTFADRAKEIKKKYPRNEWDAIERKDMMAELAKLRDEQEEYKVAVGIADDSDRMDAEEQGEPQGLSEEQEGEQRYGGHYIPGNMGSTYAYGGSYPNGGWNRFNAPIDQLIPNMGNPNALRKPIGTNVNASGNNPQFRSPSSSFLPFAISGLSSVAGDIAGMANINRNMPKNITLPRVSAQNISLEPQRKALERSYNTATNIALRNSRDVSNPANAYANQVAGITGLTDSLGNQMSQSYMNEANTNTQIQNRANEQNAQIGSQQVLTNAQLQGNIAQARGQFINSLSQTVPMMLRDYRQQSNDTNLINNMGKDFGQYEQIDPNETSLERYRRLLFGPKTTTLNKLDPRIRQQ